MIEGINRLIRSCYGGHNPDYPGLSTFEEGKFVNLLIPYLKAEIEKIAKPVEVTRDKLATTDKPNAIIISIKDWQDILAKLEEK